MTTFRQEFVGANYQGTSGVKVPATGQVNGMAVPYEELSATEAALQAAIAQLESSLAASISSGDATLQSEISGLNLLTEAQVQTLISSAIVGGVRYKGVAHADEATPAAATGTSTFAQGDLYRVSTNGSTAFGVGLSAGDYVLYNGSAWDKIDSTDPSVSSGDSVVVVTQTGDNQYSVKIAQSFLDRIAGIETNLAGEVTRATAAEAALATGAATISTNLASEVTRAEAAEAALAGRATAIEAVNATQENDLLAIDGRLDTAEATISSQGSALSGKASTSALNAVVSNQATVDAAQNAAIALKADQSAVDTIVSAQATTDAAQNAAIAAEVTARTNADTTLQTNITAEATARASAVSGLEATVTAGDATLQSAIDAEATARAAGDATLTTTVGTKASQVDLAQEVSDRTSADTTLQSAIDAEATARASAVSGEATARIAGDAALQSAVDAEVTARTSADATLQSEIDAEATARASAVSGEATARIAGDATLQSAVDAEATARIAGDAAINTSLTDARATIVTHGTEILALQSDKIDRTLAVSAIAQSHAALEKDELLTNGVWDASNHVTRFYVPGFSSAIDWKVFPINEVVSPYRQMPLPEICYYTYANLPSTAPSGLDSSKSYAEVSIFSPTQYPDNALVVWCRRKPSLVALAALVDGFATVSSRDITLFNALNWSATNESDYTYYSDSGLTFSMSHLYDGNLNFPMNALTPVISNGITRLNVQVAMSASSYINRLLIRNGSDGGGIYAARAIRILNGSTELYSGAVQPDTGSLQTIDLTGVSALNAPLSTFTIELSQTLGNGMSVNEIQLKGYNA